MNIRHSADLKAYILLEQFRGDQEISCHYETWRFKPYYRDL
jgi:hypothetical protein